MTTLSIGQRKAIEAIVGDDPNKAVTYKEAAESLGISEWNLKTQLQRVRKKSPEKYRFNMMQRRRKLDIRHEEALERQDEHRHAWLTARVRADNRMLRQMGLGHLIPRW
tara:strand:+ start:819 stop:1145 length:327 start_codon:yes stop_codon:yes gene_type:complete